MKQLLLFVSVITLGFSCSKSENIEDKESKTNFYALKTGNSWVYKNYVYSATTKVYEESSVIDSVSIIGIEEISGEKYFKFRRLTTGNENNIHLCNKNGEHFEFLRELNGDLINEKGKVKFTNNNYEPRLLVNTKDLKIYETLVAKKTTLNVEAGIFNCINSERYAVSDNGKQLKGLDSYYYANGYGLIYDTLSFVSEETPMVVRRLYSYNIQ